jgi:putative transposase
MALTELAEKSSDANLLPQMIPVRRPAADGDLDVEALCGDGYDVKSGERANSRKGYRDRLWDTRARSIDLKIPKLRLGRLA